MWRVIQLRWLLSFETAPFWSHQCDNRWKGWLPWLLAAVVDHVLIVLCPTQNQKVFFEFCRVCSALVGVKQCHKPTMTGNGKFLTPIKNREIGGTVYGIVLPTVPKKIHHGQLHPAAQVSISRARDHSTLGGELAVQVWTWRDWNSVQRGGGKIMGWWLKMVLILNYSPVNCYITMENHHVS